MVVVVVNSSQDKFSSALAFALNCPSSPWLLGPLSSGRCFAAMVMLFGACLGGCFAVPDVVVGWMLCHRLSYRWMLCCHIAAWVDTLPPGRGRYFATGSCTLAVALPWWSRSSSFFDDGVSFLQAQFFCNLVRVVGLGVSSLPFLLLLLVVVVVMAVCWLCFPLVFLYF